MKKNSADLKKTVIVTVLGIVAVVLAGINRFFLNNMVISGIVVVLSLVFFVALIWLYATSRRTPIEAQSKQAKQKSKN